MPKTKKKKIFNKSFNITLDNRMKAAQIPGGQNKPIPPVIFEKEDFTKDLLDVGDSSNNYINLDSTDKASSTNKTPTPNPAPQKQFVGHKIPVNMREDIVRNKGGVQTPAAMNKAAHIQSNQLLKDCLSSDIKMVVQDNIRMNVPRPQMNSPNPGVRSHQPQWHAPAMTLNAPSGVPRSFLTRVDQTVIEPQLPVPDPEPSVNYVPSHQYNTPISHAGIQDPQTFTPTFTPITQDNPQPASSNTQMFGNNTTRYSPTDLYSDLGEENRDGQAREGSTSPWTAGEKRVSAFDRLGPLAQPKTPKLTINLSFNKEQAVREVVDESPRTPPPPKVHIPVHEREDVLHSTDDTVMKYVGVWPWARPVVVRRTARSRGFQSSGGGSDTSHGYSPTAMMMLKEQMDEIYQRDNSFLAVSVTGYPSSWTKEDVLDALLDNLKDKSFVPCFIEFNDKECKFLVIRSRAALLAIHALDFRIQKDGVQLCISISQIVLSVLQLDFIPRLILRKRLASIHCDGTKLNLSAFTLQPDVSHFIYYPLSHLTNQIELMKLQTDIVWCNLTELDLSRNRLTTIEGFDLENRMPRLLHLDVSYNHLERATALLCCRRLPLRALRLEGNPLCHDYTDPQRYVTVVRMMFPALRLLDDIPLNRPGEAPSYQRHYCPPDAAAVVDPFLQLFLPLLECSSDDRVYLADMYDERALLTVTYRPDYDLESGFRYPRNLLLLSRLLLEGSREFADGRPDIEKLLKRWPNFEHDPSSFTVDVLFHNESSTLFRLGGVVRLPADSLAEEEQLFAFSRTIHLRASGTEYRIANEMIYWDQPTAESAKAAFTRTLVKTKPLSFKLELPPDEYAKKKLTETFMKITQLNENCSVRCLEIKDWDIRDALDYFMKLYKVDNLEPLTKPVWNTK